MMNHVMLCVMWWPNVSEAKREEELLLLLPARCLLAGGARARARARARTLSGRLRAVWPQSIFDGVFGVSPKMSRGSSACAMLADPTIAAARAQRRLRPSRSGRLCAYVRCSLLMWGHHARRLRSGRARRFAPDRSVSLDAELWQPRVAQRAARRDGNTKRVADFSARDRRDRDRGRDRDCSPARARAGARRSLSSPFPCRAPSPA